MAKTITYKESFKRGDTPVFVFKFLAPYDGFNWSVVTADIAMTADAAPTSNASAAVLRLGQSLTVNADNNATVTMQPTPEESRALTPGINYTVEAQLKQGMANIVTPITGKVKVDQDFVI